MHFRGAQLSPLQCFLHEHFLWQVGSLDLQKLKNITFGWDDQGMLYTVIGFGPNVKNGIIHRVSREKRAFLLLSVKNSMHLLKVVRYVEEKRCYPCHQGLTI